MATIIESIKTRYAIDDADAHVGVKWCDTKAEVDRKQRLVTAIATTDAVDLVDEVVLPEGAMVDKNGKPFYANTILFNHDSDKPVGGFRSARFDRSARGWVCQFQITDKTELGRDTFFLLEEGVIKGVSIGFRAFDWGRPDKGEIEKYGPISSIVRKWLWLELSVTPVPCNPEALITDVKSMAVDDSTAKELNRMASGGYIGRKTLELMGVPVTPTKTTRIFIVN